MLEEVLQYFPRNVHPLTLVSDPDGVLADTAILEALARRGFTLVQERDPLVLRYRVEQARPWSCGHPLIVATPGELTGLPYDLWQLGFRVVLDLHTFFPQLAYPVVRELLPEQRHRLADAPSPGKSLGRQASITYILRHVFDVDLGVLATPAALVTWLDNYHRHGEQMPSLLQETLVARLGRAAALADWPLPELLSDRDAFTRFVQSQWEGYVGSLDASPVGRDDAYGYQLNFVADVALQDTLSCLVRTGTVSPVLVDSLERLPAWARPGVEKEQGDAHIRRVAALAEELSAYLRTLPVGKSRWADWRTIAHNWAELTALYYRPGDAGNAPAIVNSYTYLQKQLDARFVAWLQRSYALLGVQRLPVPHHLHHVPHYIAYRHPPDTGERVALLVLDGLALADWKVIARQWRARHPEWQFTESLLLAQIPTVTHISRQALISGLRPVDFASSIDHNRHESRLWAAFWGRFGLLEAACAYDHLHLDNQPPPPEISSTRTQALCLVDTHIDKLFHGASLGTREYYASLAVWLSDYSPHLEALIAALLGGGYHLYLTSDHGHTGATGDGIPNDGIMATSRSKRVRIYHDRAVAQTIQGGSADRLIWESDGLLPPDMWPVLQCRRRAFAHSGSKVVSHGGITLDEVVVPLVKIVS